jgi:hypothetical protein
VAGTTEIIMQIEIRHKDGTITHVVYGGHRISTAELAVMVDIWVNNLIPFASSGPELATRPPTV